MADGLSLRRSGGTKCLHASLLGSSGRLGLQAALGRAGGHLVDDAAEALLGGGLVDQHALRPRHEQQHEGIDDKTQRRAESSTGCSVSFMKGRTGKTMISGKLTVRACQSCILPTQSLRPMAAARAGVAAKREGDAIKRAQKGATSASWQLASLRI